MTNIESVLSPATSPAASRPRSFPDLAKLRELAPESLPDLAERLRQRLIETVSATGGHLGASLGTVELCIAVHRVFRSPQDSVIFDTGHQAYPHKILTGRSADFGRLRQADGLSGYPSRSESVHDIVENSHASTALSYAHGLAKGFAVRGERDRRVVALIGDGALTGGLALEALNNLGGTDLPVTVVLNDNGRSYDPTVGGLAAHLASLRADQDCRLGTYRRRPEGSLFESLGLAYVGPIDGHDVPAIEQALRTAAALRRPSVVHALTEKGRGYPPAEANADDRMHSVGVIDPATGLPVAPAKPTWTQVFGEEIARLGDERTDVVALTAAMRLPVGLGEFSFRHPGRFIDTGIAEQHAVTCAAGLAMSGLHPVVCIYATFLNRAFDQVLMDVALPRLPVTFVLDRAGITGPDGPSHHGMWDLALLAGVPGIRVAAPRDARRLRVLLREAVAVADGPSVIRFPKANAGAEIPAIATMDGMDILARSRSLPLDVLLIAIGATASACQDAEALLSAHGVGVTVVDPRWIAPVNPSLPGLVARHRIALVVEDGSRVGGIGALIEGACTDAGVTTQVHRLGLPPAFIPHAERADLLARHGLSGSAICLAAQHLLGDTPASELDRILGLATLPGSDMDSNGGERIGHGCVPDHARR
jgi:1-deoxy-D-xylulose-5-phosphate synthase